MFDLIDGNQNHNALSTSIYDSETRSNELRKLLSEENHNRQAMRFLQARYSKLLSELEMISAAMHRKSQPLFIDTLAPDMPSLNLDFIEDITLTPTTTPADEVVGPDNLIHDDIKANQVW